MVSQCEQFGRRTFSVCIYLRQHSLQSLPVEQLQLGLGTTSGG